MRNEVVATLSRPVGQPGGVTPHARQQSNTIMNSAALCRLECDDSEHTNDPKDLKTLGLVLLVAPILEQRSYGRTTLVVDLDGLLGRGLVAARGRRLEDEAVDSSEDEKLAHDARHVRLVCIIRAQSRVYFLEAFLCRLHLENPKKRGPPG